MPNIINDFHVIFKETCHLFDLFPYRHEKVAALLSLCWAAEEIRCVFDDI